jgi:hypothetical protein
MNITALDIIQGTPIWVVVLLAYLVWIGIKRLQPSVKPFSRLFIVPAVFVAWGLLGLFDHSGPFAPTLTRWLLAALVGGVLGALLVPRLQRDRRLNLVRIPASAIPLVRNVAIFGAHYVLRVAAAIHPHARDSLLGWDICVSGASAGYFIGWSMRCVQNYRRAPAVDLDTGSTPIAGTSRQSTYSNSSDSSATK